ncbi:M28 family metallopeptidase [Marilutibacter penaei]|nr:M28 family peptidase [Lysobacter penaei]
MTSSILRTRTWSMPLALTVALVAGCAHAPADIPPPATGTAAERWRDDVAAISAASPEGRRLAIEARLTEGSFAWQAQPFTLDGEQGTNVLARVAGDAEAPLLLLGAHYDRVDAGQGATDNASGSAVVLALAERFQARPLRHYRVAIAFWDLEERGLIGARAYVEQGGERPAQYVNFDVFGWGDTVWMMTREPEDTLVDATRAASEALGLGLSAGDAYPPTDHLAFIKSGWPAVSYSLVGADEIKGILAMYGGEHPPTPPRVMEVIHSEHDTVEKTDAVAASRGVDAIEAALRQWDAQAVP